MSGAQDTKARVERAARESYGRLLMMLLRHTRDIASCEDALSEAFEAALKKWPSDGIPDQPDAWLLSVARHRIIDMTRHLDMRQRTLDDLTQALQPQPSIQSEQRLPLLFLCAHPLVDERADPAHAPSGAGVERGEDRAGLYGVSSEHGQAPRARQG